MRLLNNSVTFSNGHKMPLAGLGTFLRGEDESELEKAMEAALEAGYRHIDTAYVYRNEHVIGKVLKRWLDSGKLRRQDLFIVTKLPSIGMTPEMVPYFLKKSLEDLQLTYVDLYLIHTPFGLHYVDDTTIIPVKDEMCLIDPKSKLEDVWKALECQVDVGRVKSLGLSNFNEEQVNRIVRVARHKPMNHQIELHAYFQQKPLVEHCKNLGISICAFAPLGSPGRKASYKQNGLHFQSNGLLDDPIVEKIAKAHSKTTSQVLLRFLTQQGIIVIPKSTRPIRLVENFQIFDFELTTQEMRALKALDQGKEGRTFDFSVFPGIKNHPEYPFKQT